MSINSTPANGLSRAAKIAIVAVASVVVFLFVLIILLATSSGSAAPAASTPRAANPHWHEHSRHARRQSAADYRFAR